VNAQPRIRLADFEGLPADPLPPRHYQPLDLFAPVPPVEWVVENILVKGEATLLVAEGGAGKSYFALALSLAVTIGDWFLDGRTTQGRVMYVDEEGSPSLALQRIAQLGATDEQKANLDYLSYPGVDLVRAPEKLIEEVRQVEPILVVLDSHAKIARASEENSNNEMGKVWDEGILRVARWCDCAVLVIHHTNGYGGSRGASTIRNSADQVLTMVKQEDRSRVLYPSKPRRRMNRLHFDFKKVGVGQLACVRHFDFPEWT
jgi:RecA-family ATPase